nr:ARID DNA-binding domain-containing protein [Tanacetum cinerariifolium]
MASSNPYSNKWPRLHRSTYGLANKWHQSKDWGTLRREQQLELIQRQLKRENQEHIGSCMKKISEECKSMLKNKMKEVIQHNTTLNQPTSNNRFKNYKCFQCKQLGHIVKFCPVDYKVENTDAKKETNRRMKGIEAIKPTVLITYPEIIHFSTTCMIKDTDLTGWDEIWYMSNQIDRHVCYKLDAFCNIKEGFSVTKLENKKKFLFTYGMGEILIEANGKSHIIPGVYYAPEVTLNILSLELLEKQGFQVNYDENRCNLSLMFTDKEIKRFDEDRLRRMQMQYLQEYFESITKGRRRLRTRHSQNQRRPLFYKGHNDALLEPAWRAEKDRECLGSYQWEISEDGAQRTRPAVLKGKKIMEHFDVQLEDTTKSPEEPTQVHFKGDQKFQKMYTVPSSSRIKEEYESSTSRTSDDFTFIT